MLTKKYKNGFLRIKIKKKMDVISIWNFYPRQYRTKKQEKTMINTIGANCKIRTKITKSEPEIKTRIRSTGRRSPIKQSGNVIFKCVRSSPIVYCLSKKSWPILYSKLLYKLGQDFLDIQNLKWILLE